MHAWYGELIAFSGLWRGALQAPGDSTPVARLYGCEEFGATDEERCGRRLPPEAARTLRLTDIPARPNGDLSSQWSVYHRSSVGKTHGRGAGRLET